jgi:hypothetical protein
MLHGISVSRPDSGDNAGMAPQYQAWRRATNMCAPAAARLAALVLSLMVLLPAPLRAQTGQAMPPIGGMPAGTAMGIPGGGIPGGGIPGGGIPGGGIPGGAAPDSTIPNQTREHFVPQHLTREGAYVPPHYEARRPPPFRGYFAGEEARRQLGQQHGYQEPAPIYTTPQDDTGQHMEGR